MKIQIIKIGNSKGIRIPKNVLNDCGFDNSAEMLVKDNKLILSPVKKSRKGWEKAFETASKKKTKDKVLEDFENMTDQWEEKEWKW